MGAKSESVAKQLDAILARDTVEALSKELEEPSWLAEKRLGAWDAARVMPAPAYVRQTYEEKPFWSYLITEHGKGAVTLGDVLTPIAGRGSKIRATLSGGNGVVFQSLHDALGEREELVKEHFMTDGVRAEENLFAAVHGAAFESGAVVHVPPDFEAEEPLILDTIMDGSSLFDHILIVAEPNSRVTFVDVIHSRNSTDRAYRSGMVEIFVKDGAQVSYVGVQDMRHAVTCFTHKRAVVGRDATIDWLDITFGGGHVKSDVTSLMVGPGGHAEVRGARLGVGEQLHELSTATIHEAPMSTGRMFSRGVLTDTARSTYRGLIHIKEKARGVNSSQDDDTLLLSEGARADAIPILEIGNNDVRCGHSAHMGKMNEDELFYIASRGLEEAAAKLVLVDGFLEPLLRGVPVEDMRERLKKEVHRRVAT